MSRAGTHGRTTGPRTRAERLPLPAAEIDEFLEEVRRLSRLALFNPYFDGSREEFGFLSPRTGGGTLITGRGSSKSQAEADDLSLVTDLDEGRRTLAVSSVQRKASLNANIAHLAFRHRPDIQYIVHAHIELPGLVGPIARRAQERKKTGRALRS